VYEELSVEAVPGALRAFASSYRAALGGVERATAARRVEPAVWSALEYACHVRDVFLVERDRAVLAQVKDRPGLAPMSRDERVSICRYDSQSPADVLDQLAMTSELLALVLEGLTPAGWARELTYNYPGPEVRDLAWVGRHTVHEGTHHLYDIHRVLAGARAG
jgi:hypothetical protein